jgi:hypothetical protein
MSSFLGLDRKGRSAMKANEVFMANMIGGLKSLGKLAHATMAAEALIQSIRHTHQDSSRAAANWDLAFDPGEVRDFLSPHAYGALKRGSGGANEDEVLDYKAMVYGIGQEGPGGFLTIRVGGLLHTRMGVGKFGTAPQVLLFNPVMSSVQARRQGWEHDGNTYAQNAWPGEFQVESLRYDVEQVGSGIIQKVLRDLNSGIIRGVGHGKLGE